MVDLFVLVSTDRTVQYKLNAQFLRLFGLHSDVNDVHRAGANRLQNKTNLKDGEEVNMQMVGSMTARSSRGWPGWRSVGSERKMSQAGSG